MFEYKIRVAVILDHFYSIYTPVHRDVDKNKQKHFIVQ